MLSGYSCFCRDAPVACRLGLAEAVLCGEGGFACPGALAGSLDTAGGEDPADGTVPAGEMVCLSSAGGGGVAEGRMNPPPRLPSAAGGGPLT